MSAHPLPRVVLSHTHDQGVAYRAALACQHLGLPFRLITGLYYRPGRLPYSLLGLLPQRTRAPLEAKLRRRRLEGLDDGAVVSFGLPLAELSMRLTRSDRLAGLFHDRLVSAWLRRHAARGEWTIFHGYIGRCLSSLAAAKRCGMKALVEVTLPPTSLRFVAAEEEREGIRPGAWLDADEKAQLAELREADYVVAQNSYSVSELRRLGIPPGRIFLVPLGIDLERFRPAAKAAGPRPFRVLFVGQISIRKGLHHLLRAWLRLGLEDAELWVAGHVVDAAVAAELTNIEAFWPGHTSYKGMFAVDAGSTQSVLQTIQKYGLKGKVSAGGYDLTPITEKLLAAGYGQFTIDQQPYLQGFLPTLELFLYKASHALSGIADVDTGLKFLTPTTVVPYSSTTSRYEGTGSAPGVK